jgi:hypothetical protein
MTISKPTFTPSTPCTIYFECLESGPNDSTEFVDSHVYFDNIYPSSWELLVPTFRIFEQFDWAPRNQNCKTDMEPQIKILKLLCQTYATYD